LSLHGVVAHYLNHNFEPRAILLAMPRMQGSHTAVNLQSQISGLIDYFGLNRTLSYAVTDNASENRAYLNLMADELVFDAGTLLTLWLTRSSSAPTSSRLNMSLNTQLRPKLLSLLLGAAKGRSANFTTSSATSFIQPSAKMPSLLYNQWPKNHRRLASPCIARLSVLSATT
jgi:hypothetical protein